MKPMRAKALLSTCPKCGVAPGVSCTRVNGAERHSVHRERIGRLPEVTEAIARDRFYSSDEWRQVRYSVLKASNGACQCCGARGSASLRLHVDHIKPRSRFPELALKPNNLQVLCPDCNIGKRTSDQTDWRQA